MGDVEISGINTIFIDATSFASCEYPQFKGVEASGNIYENIHRGVYWTQRFNGLSGDIHARRQGCDQHPIGTGHSNG